MRINVPEDSGNAQDIEITGPASARFAIRPDNRAPFRQWFWIRCEDLPSEPIELRLVGAASASYPRGWDGYAAVASVDGGDWRRAPTVRDAGPAGDALVIRVAPEPGARTLDVAYFAPYTHARRVAQIARWSADPRARVTELGPTPDGLSLPLVAVGRGERPIWVVARQHPGETMGEWFAEGLLDRLLSRGDRDPAVERLLARATVRVVPCVNPDGARRGNHRTNALGVDLNRTWHDPDPALAPEVYAIRREMDAAGVAFGLDVHGDEEIPYNFTSGAEAVPSWDPERAALRERFLAGWIAADPEMQVRHGYPKTAPGAANLSVCSNQLTERYRCVALTVEQPFKDNADLPDPRTGWSAARSRALGASVIDAWISSGLTD